MFENAMHVTSNELNAYNEQITLHTHTYNEFVKKKNSKTMEKIEQICKLCCFIII